MWAFLGGIFVIVWWTVIFAVLPFGIKIKKNKPGEVSSAPSNPRLLLKFAITTLISLAFCAVIYVLVKTGAVDFEKIIFGLKK